MYIIDYLDFIDDNLINISPFHTGHLGLIPETGINSSLLISDNKIGSEICITHYPPSKFPYLFRLKCVLKEDKGVFHKLLKAISIMQLNIISSESVTLESKKGHGVSLLLDWSGTKYTEKQPLSKNTRNLFFPILSNIIPSNDRRYLTLLRQILGQCANILDWSKQNEDGISYPRIKITEFDEKRLNDDSDKSEILRPFARKRSDEYHKKIGVVKELFRKNNIKEDYIAFGKFKDLLMKSGVQIKFDDDFISKLKLKTGREETGNRIPYIALSDIESKTLRLFIPRKQAEKRIVSISLSHLNKPGALFAITKLVADSGFSIYSSLVRKYKADRNIFEATLEHKNKIINIEDLSKNPEKWINEYLKIDKDNNESLLSMFDVTLEKPQYPSTIKIERTKLVAIDREKNSDIILFPKGEEEKDIARMKGFLTKDKKFKDCNWLTNLLFADEWGPKGKPKIFLSYPSSAAQEAKYIIQELGSKFTFDFLQRGQLKTAESKNLGNTAVERIKGAQYFIGLWKFDDKQPGNISPWMLFEYGVARSSDKPFTILTDNKLDKRLFRIDTDIRRINFAEIIMDERVMREIKRDTEEWLLSHERLSL